MKRYVAYYRVSTAKQGQSGLGLAGQRECIEHSTSDGEIVQEFTEIESGNKANRPELSKAIALCKKTGAVLIIAKLDRLARNVSFIFSLRDAGVDFKACDLPDFNTLTLGVFASFAEYERERIVERTSMALKKRRERVGEWRVSNLDDNARAKAYATNTQKAKDNEYTKRAKAYAVALRNTSKRVTLQEVADALNENGYRTPGDIKDVGMKFTRMQVSRLLHAR